MNVSTFDFLEGNLQEDVKFYLTWEMVRSMFSPECLCLWGGLLKTFIDHEN